MIKAVFIAHQYQEAAYWAKLWGYEQREVYIVTRVRQLHGLRPSPGFPVYICGSREPIEDHFMDYLNAVGFETIDAQNIDVPGNPETETYWL